MQITQNVKSVELVPFPVGIPIAQSNCLTETPVQSTSERKSVTLEFVEAMKDFLNDAATKNAYRGLSRDFTRERKLPFQRLCVGILKDHARSTQTRLLDLFREINSGTKTSPPTTSAFSQARDKLLGEFFHEWTRRAVDFFYAHFPRESLVSTWRGRRLMAVDCSHVTLPDNPETRYFYSIQTNQIPGSETVCGLASYLHDLLNEMPVNGCLEKVQILV
ncbi:MAG: hypothetical protein Q6370_023425 [Candidatus Sigynarchaeota archaeon]